MLPVFMEIESSLRSAFNLLFGYALRREGVYTAVNKSAER